MLRQAGIATPEALRALGAVDVFIKVQRSGAKPTLNLLWALEGAIREISWQEVAQEQRRVLLDRLDARRKEI
jgi:hypothetical protein